MMSRRNEGARADGAGQSPKQEAGGAGQSPKQKARADGVRSKRPVAPSESEAIGTRRWRRSESEAKGPRRWRRRSPKQ
jgi:hypothetical protein